MLDRKCNGSAWLMATVLLACLFSSAARAVVEPLSDADEHVDPVGRELEQALSASSMPATAVPLDQQALQAFYRARNFRPAWCDARGVHFNAQRWLSVLATIETPGNPVAAHLPAIQRQLNAAGPHERAVLDLLLTDSFLAYVSAISRVQLTPAQMHEHWYLSPPAIEPARVLEAALESGDFTAALAGLEPAHPAYRRLREQLESYLTLQANGGWPRISARGERLEPGVYSDEIATLRELLMLTGDLAADDSRETFYDALLEQGVRSFQRRHGLIADGIIGKATRAALAVPVSERIGQLRVNLERWRWLPRDLGERYITVNSAAFELEVHAGNSVPLSMRVIVGKQERETPVFVEKMRYMVVNPYWRVPSKIAKEDLIPAVMRDESYFASKGIRVLSGWDADAIEVNAGDIDWQGYLGDRYLPYQLRQDPGPANALGRIKFMLPNQHSIYLHDTPSRNLFNRAVRAFSSGCIRVEDPLALAHFVLGDDAEAQQILEEVLESGDTRILSLPEPIPVYLLYHTAWVSEDGSLNFRADVYQRDQQLLAALPALDTARQVTQSVKKLPNVDRVSLLHQDRASVNRVKRLVNR